MNSVFDNFIEKAKDIADIATQKTGELVEVSKLKLECVKLHNDLKALYEKLGSAVYRIKKNDFENDDLIDSLVEEIDEQLELLKATNEKIAEHKSTEVCPACGTKNTIESFYCSKCGCKLKSEFSDYEDNSL